MKISKKTTNFFFSCPKDHSTQKLGSQVKRCDLQPVHRQTDTQTHRVTTEGTLSGVQDYFLQPIIKDRPNSFPFPSSNLVPSLMHFMLLKKCSSHLWGSPDRSKNVRNTSISHDSLINSKVLKAVSDIMLILHKSQTRDTTICVSYTYVSVGETPFCIR